LLLWGNVLLWSQLAACWPQMKRYEAAVVRLEKAKEAEKELEAIMKVRHSSPGGT